MKKVAIIFNHPPHGSARGREGLDLSLALSDINQISIFFINNGVFHLLENQQPDKILLRDYIATFGMLELYDIENIYICQQSLIERKIDRLPHVIDGALVDKQTIVKLLADHNAIIQF
ncbi:sulfurtransferase complex subunit TusC [Orbus mooreae]|uniref:sulfurtransferase complex subunit TusC n=1 Tax=Orbus mooreae TaxID=3074107 RepID=UPI00370D8E91